MACQSRKGNGIIDLECIRGEWEELGSELLSVSSSFNVNQLIPVEVWWDDPGSWDFRL